MYNNTCCLDIISFALFKKSSSPGRKYPRKFGPPFRLEMLAFGYTIVSLVYQHYFHKAELENVQIRCCLDEWKEGTRQDIHLDSRTYDRIYDRILADIQAADQIPYYNKRLLEMRTAWWNQAMYVPSLNYNSGFLTGSKVLFYEVATNSDPHTAPSPGGYRKLFPLAPGLPLGASPTTPASTMVTVTPQIPISTLTPAIGTYPMSQLAMPVAGRRSLDSVPLDQRYDVEYNMYGDWIRSSDPGWESESCCKPHLMFF